MPRRNNLPHATILLLVAGSGLSGCAGLGDVAPEAAGLGAGAGAGVLTANPLVGLAVGLGARLATAEAVGYVKTERRHRVQRAIAVAAGNAEGAAPVSWSMRPDAFYDTFFGTLDGHVQVAREFGNRIRCREIIYTVEETGDGIETAIADTPAEVQATGDAVEDWAGNAPDDTAAGNAAGVAEPARQARQDDWPEAITDPVNVAVVCYGALGWQWAVSLPSAHEPW